MGLYKHVAALVEHTYIFKINKIQNKRYVNVDESEGMYNCNIDLILFNFVLFILSYL